MNNSSKSVSSEEIAAATVDWDVAVGNGSTYRLGSEGMEIGGTKESAVAVVGTDGEGEFLDLLNNCTFEFVEDHVFDESGNGIDRLSASHNPHTGRPRTNPHPPLAPHHYDLGQLERHL